MPVFSTLASLSFAGLLALAIPLLPRPAPNDWIIHGGETVVYDTAAGPVHVNRLEVQSGGVLRIVGRERFELHAWREIRVAGLLDLSGADQPGVGMPNTTCRSEPGSLGHTGGGHGGLGNPLTQQSTPVGGSGFGSGQTPAMGGGGGETSYSLAGMACRRGAGGGGGAFGPDRSVEGDSASIGLVAESGWEGGPCGKGALSDQSPAQGGSPGPRPFTDGNPDNDFYGRKRLATGILLGELDAPSAGSGGGAGGNAVDSATFPLVPFTCTGDEKGAGGAGGGGLGILLTRRIVLLPGGRIVLDGGDGGGGENPSSGGFSHVGGGSGGGSGGQIIVQAALFDLSSADANSMRAIGGRGGPGLDNDHDVTGAGGDGGPGLIQLHTPGGAADSILLPPGATLEELTLPDAQVLLPEGAF